MTNYVVPPVISPDIEDLGMYFYTPLLAPTPIDTRLPSPDADKDTINGFMTIEAGDTSRFGLAQWDCDFLLHAYSPVEAEASDLSRRAMAYGTSVQGLTVMGWYIVGLVTAIGGRRLPNPDVPGLTRYRSALTWRVAAKPI